MGFEFNNNINDNPTNRSIFGFGTNNINSNSNPITFGFGNSLGSNPFNMGSNPMFGTAANNKIENSSNPFELNNQRATNNLNTNLDQSKNSNILGNLLGNKNGLINNQNQSLDNSKIEKMTEIVDKIEDLDQMPHL